MSTMSAPKPPLGMSEQQWQRYTDDMKVGVVLFAADQLQGLALEVEDVGRDVDFLDVAGPLRSLARELYEVADDLESAAEELREGEKQT